MGVAIKTNIKCMPEYCDDCRWFGTRPHPYKGWSDLCELMNQCMDDDQPKEWIYDGNGRPQACPLIEVAEQTEPKGERSGSLIDLYINDSGTIKRIGDNQHDQLTIDEDGKLHYYNLQNGDGCVLGEKREHDGCFYEFVANTDEYGYNCDPRVEQIEPKMNKCYKCGRWNYSHGCQSEKGICEYEPKIEPKIKPKGEE